MNFIYSDEVYILVSLIGKHVSVYSYFRILSVASCLCFLSAAHTGKCSLHQVENVSILTYLQGGGNRITEKFTTGKNTSS